MPFQAWDEPVDGQWKERDMEAQFPATPEATEGQMSDEQLIAEMLAGLEGVSSGPWWSDTERGDTFDAYAVYCEPSYLNGKPISICDTHNAGAVEIEQEDGRPWDEQGRKNMAHIARCSPDNIRRLIALARSHADIEAGDEAVAWQRFTNLIEPKWVEIEADEKAEFERLGYPVRALYTHPSPPIDGLVERALEPILDILCDPSEELQDYIECDLERMEWKGKAEAADGLVERLTALETERDAYLEELGRVIMACPMRPDMRMSPASQGVQNLRAAFEASEAAVGAMRELLVESRKQLTAIIDDGLQTDFKSWRDDIDAAISGGSDAGK